MATGFRYHIPAFALVALVHVAAVIAFLDAIIIEREPPKSAPDEHETQITLTRESPPPPPPPPPKRKSRLPAAAGGSTAITTPYFNPYAYQTAPVTPGTTDGIALALSACEPGRSDLASAEVRAACGRIGMALKNDPGHFGIVSEVTDPKHWSRELARREAPHLLPCMKAHPPPVAGHDIKPIAEIDLATLLCVSRILFIGYDSEKHERYSQ